MRWHYYAEASHRCKFENGSLLEDSFNLLKPQPPSSKTTQVMGLCGAWLQSALQSDVQCSVSEKAVRAATAVRSPHANASGPGKGIAACGLQQIGWAPHCVHNCRASCRRWPRTRRPSYVWQSPSTPSTSFTHLNLVSAVDSSSVARCLVGDDSAWPACDTRSSEVRPRTKACPTEVSAENTRTFFSRVFSQCVCYLYWGCVGCGALRGRAVTRSHTRYSHITVV